MTRLWFDALVAAANTCAWAASRQNYTREPGAKVSTMVFARGAPSATTMRHALHYAQFLWLFRKCGDFYRPWPPHGEMDQINSEMLFLEKYAQIAEYIATNMDQRRRRAADDWAMRASAANAALQQQHEAHP